MSKYAWKIVLLAIVAFIPGAGWGLHSGHAEGEHAIPGPTTIWSLNPGDEGTPSERSADSPFLERQPLSVAAHAATATLVVTYHDFPPEPKAAFQAAVDKWAALISSSVPISIDATWADLGGADSRGSIQLGGANTTQFWRDFSNAPLPKTYYPSALANKLAGRDLNPELAEIRARFNSNLAVQWYFGTSGTPAGALDFESTVLHELGHGLGFLSRMVVADGKGSWGSSEDPDVPYVFDTFMENQAGERTLRLASHAAPLAAELTSDNLWFSSPSVLLANNGQRAKLYAPKEWRPGSSASHLDQTTFESSATNALMVPFTRRGASTLDPGPVAVAIMRDLGWAPDPSGKLLVQPAGLANGTSFVDAAFVGTAGATPAALGQEVEFRVMAAIGSLAVPRFENGLTTITVPIGGSACDGTTDAAPSVPLAAKCVAHANFSSPSPGKVRVVARNAAFPDSAAVAGDLTPEFIEPRYIVPAMRKPDGYVFAQNTSEASGLIVIDFYTSDGVNVPAGRRSGETPAGAIFNALTAGNAGLDASFSGVAIVGSARPVVATSRRVHQLDGTRSSASMTNGAPLSAAITGNTTTLPYVANQLGGIYNTHLTIANSGVTPACAVITYAFVAGAGSTPLGGRAPLVDAGPSGSCASGYAVPVNGQVEFSPNPTVLRGALAMPEGSRDALMAATVVATGGSVMAAVEAYTTDGTAKAAAYEGFLVASSGGSRTPDLGKSVAIPLALKTNDGYYTQILLSNPNTAAAATTITYTGNTGTHTVVLTVPANGVANHSVYADGTVPLGFVGAATVTADQPIAAVVFRAKKVSPTSEADEDLYTAVNGVATANAAKRLLFPLVSRRVGKAAGREGINSWISVSVPGGGTAEVTLSAVATRVNGCTLATGTAYTTTKTITGSFVFYQNLDADNGFGANPDCFEGGIVLTSNVPVVGVASSISDLGSGDQEGVYNAITG